MPTRSSDTIDVAPRTGAEATQPCPVGCRRRRGCQGHAPRAQGRHHRASRRAPVPAAAQPGAESADVADDEDADDVQPLKATPQRVAARTGARRAPAPSPPTSPPNKTEAPPASPPDSSGDACRGSAADERFAAAVESARELCSSDLAKARAGRLAPKARPEITGAISLAMPKACPPPPGAMALPMACPPPVGMGPKEHAPAKTMGTRRTICGTRHAV